MPTVKCATSRDDLIMVVKIGVFTLFTAIPMVLYDKGPMTKAECFEIFKPLEITNSEFEEGWKSSRDLNIIRPDFRIDDDHNTIYKFRAEDEVGSMAKYIPKLWEAILGDSPVKNYQITITCKEMHKDRVLKGIKDVAGIIDVVS